MKQFYEERAVSLALQTYLASKGWTDLRFKEGWDNPTDIAFRDVSVYIVRNAKVQLELGQTSKTFVRPVQIDAYMETETQAGAIVDDIMDFMDEVPIAIQDEHNTVLGDMICSTNSIVSDKIPPIFGNPEITWWRGVARGIYEAHYLD